MKKEKKPERESMGGKWNGEKSEARERKKDGDREKSILIPLTLHTLMIII